MMKAAAALSLFCLLVAPAAAQVSDISKLTGNENGRYSMSPVADGIMRLDTRTGQVTHCRMRDDAWVCEILPDERTAYEKEIGRLQDRIAKLETVPGRDEGKKELKLDERAAYEQEIGRLRDRVAKLEAELGRSGKKEEPKLPDDAEVDRAMKFFENVLRRFKMMIENLQGEGPGQRT